MTAPDRAQSIWRPQPGAECDLVLRRALPNHESVRAQVLESAQRILGAGIDPRVVESKPRTGLVVGHVQSGKTLSFEAVSALARDNGFQLVILIAGRSNLLLDQSTQRFRADLDIDNADRPRRWLCIKNPSIRHHVAQVSDALDAWRYAAAPEYVKRTVLITVLKHQGRIADVASLLAECANAAGATAFAGPALVIDDEADQASLDIGITDDGASAIHSAILDLRVVLERHTYLQYTATPQAPLLISTRNSLSADFARILDPGPDYVGGDEFMIERSSQVSVIPPEDIEMVEQLTTAPPESLCEALRMFAIGVSVGLQEGKNSGNRSMLIHPSRMRAVHEACFALVRTVWDRWDDTLQAEFGDTDGLLTEFRSTYDRMAAACGAGRLMSFERIWEGLPWALRQTQILEVNSRRGRTPDVDWLNYYSHVLVGGDAMNRGFTVEGLTVTYLGRSLGSGNADTIQQRARFYGYKAGYLDYCHVFLCEPVREALVHYVPHEHHFRQALGELDRLDEPLQRWPRHFTLHPDLRPCRESVLSDPLFRRSFGDQWFTCARIASSRAGNEHLLAEWESNLRELSFEPDEGHPQRTPQQRHQLVKDVPLAQVAEWLASDSLTRPHRDSLVLLAQLGDVLRREPLTSCSIYRMSSGSDREREVGADGSVNSQLFQGANPVEGYRRGEYYPGDRSIIDPNQARVTLQLHYVRPTGDGSQLAVVGVPIPAIWLPRELAGPHDQIGQLRRSN